MDRRQHGSTSLQGAQRGRGARAVGVEVGLQALHEGGEAPEGVRLVLEHRQQRRREIAHALPWRRCSMCDSVQCRAHARHSLCRRSQWRRSRALTALSRCDRRIPVRVEGMQTAHSLPP